MKEKFMQYYAPFNYPDNLKNRVRERLSTPISNRALERTLAEEKKEWKLAKLAGATIDTIDKTLYPIDLIADLLFHHKITLMKEAVEAPFKIANTLYVSKKTGDPTIKAKDLAWEGASITPYLGVMNLTNRYSTRIDDIVVDRTVKKLEEPVFVEELSYAPA